MDSSEHNGSYISPQIYIYTLIFGKGTFLRYAKQFPSFFKF